MLRSSVLTATAGGKTSVVLPADRRNRSRTWRASFLDSRPRLAQQARHNRSLPLLTAAGHGAAPASRRQRKKAPPVSERGLTVFPPARRGGPHRARFGPAGGSAPAGWPAPECPRDSRYSKLSPNTRSLPLTCRSSSGDTSLTLPATSVAVAVST